MPSYRRRETGYLTSSNLCALTFVLLTLLCYFKKSVAIEFSQDHFVVLFTPYVRVEDVWNTYNEEDIIFFAKHFSTRFRRMVWGGDYKDLDYLPEATGHILPIAIAKLNVERAKDGLAPLDLILRVTMQDHNTTTSALGRFDLVLLLAEEANAIFSSTVTTIHILFPDSAPELEVDILEYCKKKLDSSTSRGNQYKLGILQHIAKCNARTLQHFPRKSHELTDAIVFHSFSLLSAVTGEGMNSFSQTFKTSVRACKEAMATALPSVEVSFETTWSDTVESGGRNISLLVEFWKRINDFAVTTNTTIIMREAYDIPIPLYTTRFLRNRGWWLTEHAPKYARASEFVLEEKMKFTGTFAEVHNGTSNLDQNAVLKVPKGDLGTQHDSIGGSDGEGSCGNGGTIAAIVLATILGIALTFLLVTWFVRRRRMNSVGYSHSTSDFL